MNKQKSMLRQAFPGLAVVASLAVLSGCAAPTNIQQIDRTFAITS
jgi:hypothetical protein